MILYTLVMYQTSFVLDRLCNCDKWVPVCAVTGAPPGQSGWLQQLRHHPPAVAQAH